MRVQKIDDNTYEIFQAEIRGFDWKLIRKPGQGTYAVIAGEAEYADDEEIVIEEYSSSEDREVWDKKNVMECAADARHKILLSGV